MRILNGKTFSALESKNHLEGEEIGRQSDDIKGEDGVKQVFIFKNIILAIMVRSFSVLETCFFYDLV